MQYRTGVDRFSQLGGELMGNGEGEDSIPHLSMPLLFNFPPFFTHSPSLASQTLKNGSLASRLPLTPFSKLKAV